jgi:hypothetical protein
LYILICLGVDNNDNTLEGCDPFDQNMTNIGRQLIGENENSQGSQSSISSALPLNFDNLLPQIVIVPEVRVEEQPQTQPKKRGRPFLTDEQKAANKAERDAKKQSGQAPPKKETKN